MNKTYYAKKYTTCGYSTVQLQCSTSNSPEKPKYVNIPFPFH